ncbi:hypothetical protein Hanom_Chr16g01459151 [Helianthus anomalus]
MFFPYKKYKNLIHSSLSLFVFSIYVTFWCSLFIILFAFLARLFHQGMIIWSSWR